MNKCEKFSTFLAWAFLLCRTTHTGYAQKSIITDIIASMKLFNDNTSILDKTILFILNLI
jgi:hypothetical protein